MMRQSTVFDLDGRITIILSTEDSLHIKDDPESYAFCRKLFIGGYDYAVKWQGKQTSGRYRRVNAAMEADFRERLLAALSGKTLQVPAPIENFSEAVKIGRALYRGGYDYARDDLADLLDALNEEGTAFQADAVLDKAKKKLKEYSNVMQQNPD